MGQEPRWNRQPTEKDLGTLEEVLKELGEHKPMLWSNKIPTPRFISCINWFDQHEFDFLKPKPSKKVTKPKKPKKPNIPYDLPNEPQKSPWGVDPWDKPKDPYGPWKGDPPKDPYEYRKWREEYE